MIIERLLDASRLACLRRRLQRQLAHAPEQGLISITLDLGAANEDWLTTDIARADTFYWAQPGGDELAENDAARHNRKANTRPKTPDYRLALGRAMIFSTVGVARFTALQVAFNGLLPVWQHDDSEQTGIVAAAHIGFAFEDEGQDEHPNARLCVPAILLQNQGGYASATFSCAARDGHHAVQRWCDELRASKNLRQPINKRNVWTRQAAPLPDRAFLARARAAINDIKKGTIEKVVLTRCVQIVAEHAIAVTPVLAALAYRHPECTIYGVGQSGSAFVGATPERLVSLLKGIVRADALAGTAWLSPASALAQAGSLQLQGNKNSHEQQLVVDAVRAALVPLCTSIDPPQTPEIMQVRELQHLRTRMTGRLRPGCDLFDLLAHLHPTPAVGGTPTVAARQWLHAHGEQRGAWYTGGIGWIDRHGDGEIAVPLRCARIKGAQAELFAGAGIVAGSDPEQELAETEAKLGAMIDALRHAIRWEPRPAPESGRTGTQ